MSRSIDGYLILGWVVNTEDVDSMYDEDGEYTDEISEDAQERADKILESVGIEADRFSSGPTWVRSLYYDCDEIYVGVPLAKRWTSKEVETIDQFAERIESNADAYERAAMEIYEVIVGMMPAERPCVMEIGCEA